MRTPIKAKCEDEQWRSCHLLLARAFILHIIKCFHQWSSAHSFNPVNHNTDHISLGVGRAWHCLYQRKNEGEKGGLGESLMTPQSITQENGQYKVLKWTNKLELFKKYACKSRTYFYLHSFSWPLFPNRYPCQRRALELGVCLT